MLDVLLATMSFIAAMSMFFLCWLGWTMNKQLEHNDNVINELQDEIDRLTKIINHNQKELFEEYNQ
tara:strand:- start:5146 stop:5343 length:198 start_codon:yes stop_codon:yes gene_type:complete